MTYLGRPCKHGHGQERYVMFNACVTCTRLRAETQYARNKERQRKWRELRDQATQGEGD